MSDEIQEKLSRYSDAACKRFFFGPIEKNPAGRFYVKEALIVGLTEKIPLSLSPISLVKHRSLGAIERSWVVGLFVNDGKGKNKAKFFIDNPLEAPVQIIPWEYIEEHKVFGNVAEFFHASLKSKTKTLTCREIPLIGGKGMQSNIIITQSDMFFKGFSKVDNEKIKYSQVCGFVKGSEDCAKHFSDFLDVAKYNQTVLMTFESKSFLITVPRQNNEYEANKKHSVLDYCAGSGGGKCSWEPLMFDKDDRVQREGSVGKPPLLPPLVGLKGSVIKTVPSVIGIKTVDAGGSLNSSMRDNGGIEDVLGPSVGGAIEDVIVRQKLERGANLKEAVNAHTATIQKPISSGYNLSTETEPEFLKRFIAAVRKCGFKYSSQDLIRFHTCVKCGFLTVLGGAPGMGKSSLVKLYASAVLGRENGKCKDGMLTVDVNSSWAEPADVLGYWDLEYSFRPALSAGIVPFLWAANKRRCLNLICLEEMNLARVEHYFSDFMQLSERNVSERCLKGIPPDGEMCNACKDLESLRLPIAESVRIVGTNNFDETTQRFSARFFDRCNYIELQDALGGDDFQLSQPVIDDEYFRCLVSWDTYKSWIRSASNVEVRKIKQYDDNNTDNDTEALIEKDANNGLENEVLGEETIKKYKKIRRALRNLNLKPSPRVESLFVEYIVNRIPLFDCDDCGCKTSNTKQLMALDEFVAQRILPRYSPSYLIDDTEQRNDLKNELVGMPLSHGIIERKENELQGLPG